GRAMRSSSAIQCGASPSSTDWSRAAQRLLEAEHVGEIVPVAGLEDQLAAPADGEAVAGRVAADDGRALRQHAAGTHARSAEYGAVRVHQHAFLDDRLLAVALDRKSVEYGMRCMYDTFSSTTVIYSA